MKIFPISEIENTPIRRVTLALFTVPSLVAVMALGACAATIDMFKVIRSAW